MPGWILSAYELQKRRVVSAPVLVNQNDLALEQQLRVTLSQLVDLFSARIIWSFEVLASVH